MCLRWGARTVCSAGAWGTESAWRGCADRRGPRRGPHLSISGDGLSSGTGFGGSGCRDSGRDMGPGLAGLSRGRSGVGRRVIPPILCPAPVPGGDGVRHHLEDQEDDGILTPAGKAETTTWTGVARLVLLYDDFFPPDFSPLIIVIHARVRKYGKEKMKTVHHSMTVLACFLLEEEWGEQLFRR